MRRTVEARAGSIRLQRDNHEGAFLLVEGSSDRKFYERFCDRQLCLVVSLGSKFNVISVLAILEDAGFCGVLAITDLDFDWLSPEKDVVSSNLLFTAHHDLETMLIDSPAFDRVLSEFSSEQKIKDFGRDIRTVILNAGEPVGYLRWISQRDSLNLKFSSIAFGKFVEDKRLEIDETRFIEEVQNKSQFFSYTAAYIQELISNARCDEHDPWKICCGHDLVNILSLGLKRLLGSNSDHTITVENLERCLRLAFDHADWTQTQLYSDIFLWEQTHAPFRVL